MNPLIQDNVDCLLQGIELLGRLDPAEYCRREPRCFESTVGGHMRHNIDHYQSLIDGANEQVIDYDARLRDPRVESEPAYAAERLEAIAEGLRGLTRLDVDAPVQVKMDSGSEAEDTCWSASTLRRELQFLLSHTIHHYALIAVICSLRGVETDPAFGVAPSTLRYQQGKSCAR